MSAGSAGPTGPVLPETPRTASEPITPARALAVGAHPDDVEFSAGGTVASLVKAGCEVTVVVCTNGEKGSHDFDLAQAELVRRRAEEQRAAAEIMGVTTLHMLNYPDGELTPSLEARERLARIIRQVRPDLILTHDAWQLWQLHPDHRATGLLTLDALVAARDHLYLPHLHTAENLLPWRPADVLLWSTDHPDHWVDVSQEQLEVKIRSIWAHQTQMEGRDAEVEKWVRSRAAERGAEAGCASAEAFKRLRQT